MHVGEDNLRDKTQVFLIRNTLSKVLHKKNVKEIFRWF